MKDYVQYQFYFNVFQFFFTCLVAAIAWWRTRERVNTRSLERVGEKIAEQLAVRDHRISEVERKVSNIPGSCSQHNRMEARADGHNDRLGQHKELLNAIEGDLKHLPNNEAIGKLHEKVNDVNKQLGELKAEVGKIAGALPGIAHTTEMMNEYLLEHGGKS